MIKLNKVIANIKWYLVNFPLGCTIFLVLLGIFLYSKSTLKFADEAVCLQPHFVMTGRISRLIKYALFHHGFQTLSLSILMLMLIGPIAERQLGTLRFVYTMLGVIILTGLIITVLAIILAFTSQFSNLPYDCPGLGLSAPMFAMLVVVCSNFAMKRLVFFMCLINKNLIPWVFLLIVQLLFPGTKFFSNFCGCISGNLYLLWFSNTSCLPTSLVAAADDLFAKTFSYVPLPKYLKNCGGGKLLPMSVQDSQSGCCSSKGGNGGGCSSNDGASTSSKSATSPSDVPEYKISKLVNMGFARDEAKVALAATNGNVEEATGLLAEARDVKDAVSSSQ